MSQTSYGLIQTPLPGVLSDASLRDVRGAANLDQTWNIPFGVAVARDTADGEAFSSQLIDNARMPTGSGDEILGVSVLDHTHDMGPNGTMTQSGTVGTAPGPGLLLNATFSVCRKGRIYMLCETDVAITPGAAVFVRYSQNGAGKLQLGAARMDGDTSHAKQINARFVGPSKTVPASTGGPGNVGASAGGNQSAVLVAEVELDMSFSGTIP